MKSHWLVPGLISLLSGGVGLAADDQEESSYSVIGKVTIEVEAPPRVAPEVVAPVVTETEPPRAVISAGRIHTLERVYFVSGRAEVRPQSLATLDAVAIVMITAPHLKRLRVEAHTDSVSSDNNLVLSQRRAEWVRAYLVKKGVAPERLEAEGFGDTRPIASNETNEGRQLNRRVEFIIGG